MRRPFSLLDDVNECKITRQTWAQECRKLHWMDGWIRISLEPTDSLSDSRRDVLEYSVPFHDIQYQESEWDEEESLSTRHSHFDPNVCIHRLHITHHSLGDRVRL